MHEQSTKTTACFEKHMRFFFEVPEYIFGYPLFDINDAIRFVVDALTKNGFLAVYYFPRFVYISWDMNEIENNKKNNNRMKMSTERGLDFKYKPSGKLSLDID